MDNRNNEIQDEFVEPIETENDPVSEESPINYGKEIFEMIRYFAVVIVLVLLIQHFIGQQVEVSGSSMEATLQNADHLILEKVSYQLGVPKRFDIIVFRPYDNDKDTYYIKRIIGLPGEKIQIIGNDIYVNDELIEENYGNEAMLTGGIAEQSIVLSDDEYFVLGDNRNNSKDSRTIGPVKRSAIMGRAWVRIWPFNNLGVLEHQ